MRNQKQSQGSRSLQLQTIYAFSSNTCPALLINNSAFFRIVLRPRPAGRQQLEAPSLHVPVDLLNLFFAKEAGPTRHALILSACHDHRQEIPHSLPGGNEAPQIRCELALGRVLPVAAVAVRVVKLITTKNILRDPLVTALHKDRKVHRDGLVVNGIRVFFSISFLLWT